MDVSKNWEEEEDSLLGLEQAAKRHKVGNDLQQNHVHADGPSPDREDRTAAAPPQQAADAGAAGPDVGDDGHGGGQVLPQLPRRPDTTRAGQEPARLLRARQAQAQTTQARYEQLPMHRPHMQVPEEDPEQAGEGQQRGRGGQAALQQHQDEEEVPEPEGRRFPTQAGGHGQPVAVQPRHNAAGTEATTQAVRQQLAATHRQQQPDAGLGKSAYGGAGDDRLSGFSHDGETTTTANQRKKTRSNSKHWTAREVRHRFAFGLRGGLAVCMWLVRQPREGWC